MVSVRLSVRLSVRSSVRLYSRHLLQLHSREYVWVVSRPVYAQFARIPFLPRLLLFVYELYLLSFFSACPAISEKCSAFSGEDEGT